MLKFIVLIPGVLSALTSLFRSPEKTFLNIYLPALFLLPQVSFHIPGVPDPTFASGAIIPIVVACLASRLQYWRFSLMDLLVVGFSASCVYSEYMRYINYGTKSEGVMYLNVMYKHLYFVIFPYFLTKLFTRSHAFTIRFTKRLVILITIPVLIAAYEWRFTLNPYVMFFSKIHAELKDWTPDFRKGFVRVSGPFGHPIMFGIITGTALLLHHWLKKNKLWGKRFYLLPALPISKSTIITVILWCGLFASISRAPILSTALAIFLAGVGFSKHRLKSLFFRIAIFAILAFFALQAYEYYKSASAAAADGMTVSATYRTMLISLYADYVWDRPWWGWGATTVPQVPAYQSVDNQYLFLVLQHGFVALGWFVAIFLFASLKLLIRGMSTSKISVENRSLAFTYLGIYFMIAVSFVTVYMGYQTQTLLFIITGATEGYLLACRKEAKELPPQYDTAHLALSHSR